MVVIEVSQFQFVSSSCHRVQLSRSDLCFTGHVIPMRPGPSGRSGRSPYGVLVKSDQMDKSNSNDNLKMMNYPMIKKHKSNDN